MGTARLWASWAAATFGLLVGLLTVRYRQFYPDVKKALAEEAEEAKQPNFPEAKKHFTGFKLLAHGAMLLVVCAGLVINVLAFVSIRKLRNFIGTYADIKGPNEESNAMSFGQSIVITLTGLIALTFIDKTCGESAHAVEASSWLAMLIMLGRASQRVSEGYQGEEEGRGGKAQELAWKPEGQTPW